MKTIVIAFLLFVAFLCALSTREAGRAQPNPTPPTNTLATAWGQGYSTGLAVALKEYRALEERIHLGTAQPGEGTNAWQAILDGITNNPYVSK